MSTIQSLETRLSFIEDREAIRELKARYCDICDDRHNPELITTLFSPDAVWESDRNGLHRGYDEIRKQFAIFRDRIGFSQHMVMNPVICLHGDTATGSWNFLAPITIDGNARWAFTRYEDTYVRIDGEWKIQYSRVHSRLNAVHHGEWRDTQ